MTTVKNENIKIVIAGEEIECVEEYTFLGSPVNQNGNCNQEIKCLIMLGCIAMIKMIQIQKSKDVSLMTKCRLVHTILFPITTYGCES